MFMCMGEQYGYDQRSARTRRQLNTDSRGFWTKCACSGNDAASHKKCSASTTVTDLLHVYMYLQIFLHKKFKEQSAENVP